MPENTTHSKTWHEKTYYEFLDVPQEATLKEIKEAYKSKLLSNHPDKQLKNNGSIPTPTRPSDLIPQLKEAYRVLSDPELRQTYDEELIELFGKNGIVNNGEGLDMYSLDDFEEVDKEDGSILWTRDCPRCTSSKSFELTEDDLIDNGTKVVNNGNGNDNDNNDDDNNNNGEGCYELIVQCNLCSLWIRVRYYDLNEVSSEI